VDKDDDNLEMNKKKRSSIDFNIPDSKVFSSELKWGILNLEIKLNLEINNKRRTRNIYVEIKKKNGSSIDLDIPDSKVFRSDSISCLKRKMSIYGKHFSINL